MLKVAIVICICSFYLVESAPTMAAIKDKKLPYDNKKYIMFNSERYGNQLFLRNPDYIYQQDIYTDEVLAKMSNRSNYLFYRDVYESADAELAGYIVDFISNTGKLVENVKTDLNTVVIIILCILVIILYITSLYLYRKYKHITKVIDI